MLIAAPPRPQEYHCPPTIRSRDGLQVGVIYNCGCRPVFTPRCQGHWGCAMVTGASVHAAIRESSVRKSRAISTAGTWVEARYKLVDNRISDVASACLRLSLCVYTSASGPSVRMVNNRVNNVDSAYLGLSFLSCTSAAGSVSLGWWATLVVDSVESTCLCPSLLVCRPDSPGPATHPASGPEIVLECERQD